MNSENKNKINILKRKNRRNLLIKELSKHMEISLESFLDVDDNEDFCKRIFKKLETIKDKTIIQGKDFKENIYLSKKKLKDEIKNIEIKDESVRVLFFGDLEIEAVKLNIEDVIANIDKLLKFIGFLDGCGDFIMVEEYLKHGICIEITEYYYEMSIWI